jgi:mono/diheme cytochrome c family protein
LGPVRAAALAAAIAVAGFAAGAAGAACGKDKPNTAAQAKAGAGLFAANCATCHGANATGGTGPVLNSRQFLTTADDLTIKNTVRVGLAGTPMRPWGKEFGGPFDDKQIGQITAYLRSLEPNAPSVPNWRQGKPATP